mmetsp:Transcript_82450/g.254857  ORF Transcript_82450/g.254857 Transcript_82450/m.254857 type:complete len:203 (-) Transcript_82450:120-728(-)
MAAEHPHNAKRGFMQAAIIRVGLQHCGQRGEPTGRQQDVLHLPAVLGAGPDRGGHVRTRVDDHRVVEGSHERIHSPTLQDGYAAVLLDRKVAQEAAHRDHEGGVVDAPLQRVHHQRNAVAVLDGAPVPRPLGHEGQGSDGILHDPCVVGLLPQEVHHSWNRSQTADDGIGTLHNAQCGQDLQAMLRCGGVGHALLLQEIGRC